MVHATHDDRIPEAELERLRQQVLAEISRTVPLTKAGRSHRACCPKHREQTPSFHVFPERRGPRLPPGYHCFGCGWHGTIFDWVAWRDGLRLPDDFLAVVARIDPAAVDPGRPALPVRHSEGQPPKPEAAAPAPSYTDLPEAYLGDDEALACLTVALGHYQACLAEDPAAQTYLLGRGLPPALLTTRQIGYGPIDPEPQARLGFVLQFHGIAPDVARRVGLLDRQGREYFAGRLTFPEWRGGRCIWATGRAFRDPRTGGLDLAPAGGAKYKGLPLPPGRRKPLVNWEAVQGQPIIGVTEGQMDELALASLGLVAAGLNGAALASNPDLLTLFGGFDRLYLVVDLDQAGWKARRAFQRAHGERVSPVLIPPTVRRLGRYLAWLATTSRQLVAAGGLAPAHRRQLDALADRLPRVVAAITGSAVEPSTRLGDPAGLVAAFQADPALCREIVGALLQVARWFRPAWEEQHGHGGS